MFDEKELQMWDKNVKKIYEHEGLWIVIDLERI
jgi:hypothetical protein